MADFQERAAGIGALADPLRRDLYFYVCAQDHPVTSDEAADGLDLPLHKAKFHLNRLADEGLLLVRESRSGCARVALSGYLDRPSFAR